MTEEIALELAIQEDPYMGAVSPEMLEKFAKNCGVSLETSLELINAKRERRSIPLLDKARYQMIDIFTSPGSVSQIENKIKKPEKNSTPDQNHNLKINWRK